MNWRFWKPPHTVESVTQRLIEGFRDGSVVLDEPLADEAFDDDMIVDELVVQIDVPEGTSDAIILDRVKQCAMSADQENRYQGGAGLRVDKIFIQFPKVKVAFRPGGLTKPTSGA